MTTPILRLTEYRPRDLRLRRTDVDALLAHQQRPIEVVPTGQAGRFRFTNQGFAGVLHTPNLRIVLRPKIPAANLYLLLDPDAPPENTSDAVAAEPGTEAIEFLARRLADEMRRRAATGLSRGYVERSDRQPFLQGRLDFAAKARESPAARALFHTTHDEFSSDLAVHRLPKATAELLITSPFIGTGSRSMLQAALAGYAEVPTVAVDPATFNTIPTDRLPDTDRRLIDLCRMLVNSLRPGDAAGSIAAPGFFLNLERAFEQYVERGVQSGLPMGSLDVQREFTYHGPVPAGHPPLTGRPDVVLRRDGQVRCVFDAKWKSLDGPPPAADVHQALAYAVGLGCRDVRLVYPGRRYQSWRYELAHGKTVLTIHTLRVVGERVKCLKSIERLCRAVG
jgi:5-methylcytosine-specific restriction enzyme subunit McrC